MNLSDSKEPVISLGLMSGTSLDGIDAALIETDGEAVSDVGPFLTVPYPDSFRERLKRAVEEAARANALTTDATLISDLTSLHLDCVRTLRASDGAKGKWSSPQIIGFHGHTTLHRPETRVTQQIGDPVQLATDAGIPVVADFRIFDVESGGQGAPLAPVFHASMLYSTSKPVAIVNVGGISNITWIGPNQDDLIAFDTGPGNGLMDAWVEEKFGIRFDEGGSLAAQGNIDSTVLGKLLDHRYFALDYPKSLDRSDFSLEALSGVNPSDGVATLLAFTVKTIVAGLDQCPKPPRALYVTGGGRHNKTLMQQLSAASPWSVYPIEDVGWNGDMVEAQAFAYMAVRSVRGLPLTYSKTTGVSRPLSGGTLSYPEG
ncbi:MAG: anhydro-N-acetylmuramic acid kinase [Alphaproteobacteria bacterium]|nr:anhydro-N-acetylmuramic acid kinase [Alphaproteobacteria bacterium]